VALAPGYVAHETTIILAQTLTHAPLPGDEPESIELVPWPMDRLTELVARDELSEARSIAALYLARSPLEASKGGLR
jgi:ADP-ribose diphosphatase